MQRKSRARQIDNIFTPPMSVLSKNVTKTKSRAPYFLTFKKRRDKVLMTKLIKYLQEEFAYTSCPGLVYTVNQNIHFLERLFWIVSVIVSVVLIFYLIGFQLARFFEAPIVMSVEMDYFNWNVSYPAFTLCPTIKVDKEAFEALVNETNARTGKNMEAYLMTIVSVTMENLGVVDLEFPPDIVKSIDPKEYAGIAMSVFKKFDNASMTTNTNWPVTIDEAITEAGMCHIVNSNVAVLLKPSEWNRTTIYKKKNIELSFHDQGFFVQLQDYADIYKVFIHSPDEPILGSSPSYTHSLKGFASFGVTIWSSRISDNLKDSPLRLRRCRFTNEPVEGRYPIYSYNFCLLECRVKMILRLCGCVPHFYKPLDSEETCSLTDLQCVNEHRREILSLSTSTETLLNLTNQDDLPKSSHDCGCISKCESDGFRKEYENFVSQTSSNRLRIGISSFPKVRVVREIIFEAHDAILKVGGVINLCTGASLITLIELVVISLRIPISYVYKTLKEKLLISHRK